MFHWIYVYVYMYMCVHVYVCMYMYVCICMYACICVYLYMYMYLYGFIRSEYLRLDNMAAFEFSPLNLRNFYLIMSANCFMPC